MTTFSNSQPLLEVIKEHKNGEPVGIYSVCSANHFVIEACMLQATLDESYLLIESTCNQVNQFGGYTGMKPGDFTNYIISTAERMNFPSQRIILGGDHLGPNPWQNEIAETAMEYSRKLVRDYVQAGYTKIHLDTSVPCMDDFPGLLDANICAKRAADLCAVAEMEKSKENLPVYIIGTEVPVPGGETAGAARPQITQPEEAQHTIEAFQQAFNKRGLTSVWERVIGLVVQPGVEFGDDVIFDYNREESKYLSLMIESVPGIVYEAHSTDYQLPIHLRQMVEDHFAILKVGPGLTFAMREAIFALASIEHEYLGEKSSRLIETVERVMQVESKFWNNYYLGSKENQLLARKYSRSDRIRYYWSHPELQKALSCMIMNLSQKPIPLSLISQFLPDLYFQIREKSINNEPISIIYARIQEIAKHYISACRV